MDGGAVVPLDDPMSANGTLLDNNLQTITAPLTGTGASLTLTLTATTNGGTEGFAFQNIVIAVGGGGGPVDPPFGSFSGVVRLQVDVVQVVHGVFSDRC